MKVVLCGPPRSGKSCLRQGLKEAIATIPGAPYCYVITACPDGEGAWFQETMRNDPELAATCKAAYKGQFTPEFVQRIADSVRNCSLPLTLVDIGGVPDEKNEAICAGATDAILLAGDPRSFEHWREFCARVGLRILAEIWSDYHGQADTVQTHDSGLLTGSVHHLERGAAVADRPMIRALAEHVVARLNAQV